MVMMMMMMMNDDDDDMTVSGELRVFELVGRV